MKKIESPKYSFKICFILSVLFHIVLIASWNLSQQSHNKNQGLNQDQVNQAKNHHGHTVNLNFFKRQSTSTKNIGLQNKKFLNQEISNVSTSNAPNDLGGGNSEEFALSARQKYSQDFRKMIESKKHYPAMARVRGMEGVVVIGVTIKSNGEVSNYRVIKQSGFSILDEATKEIVKEILFFKPFPEELSGPEIELEYPVVYKLNG